MRKLFCLISLALLLISTLSFSACTSSDENAATEDSISDYQGEVNVYNWGEYISNGDDDTLDVIAEFEKEYDIKVNYTNFETNEEMYNILSNSNSTYDVIIPSDYMIARLIEENMLEEIDYSNIPNYKNILDNFKTSDYDPQGKYSVAYAWGYVAMVYNTTMIEKGSIDSFSALWDKKYKDNVLMFNNSRDATAIAMQVCDPAIDPGSKNFSIEDIDRATNKLIEQKSILKKYVMDQVFTEMEGNQAAIAPYYAGDIYTMMQNNPDLDYCKPKEGSNLFVDAMCIPTCCKNKENAELFINFMCRPDIAAANAEYIGYATPNSAAYDLLDDDIKNSELVYPSQEYMDKCYTFSNIDDEIYSYMQEKFVKACSSSAEISELETKQTSNSAKIAVLVILCVIIIATIIVIIYDIRRAIKNKNRINKI